MQLGITIPLQKHLKIKILPYGEQSDLFYCWELHIIRLQGKNTLIAVNVLDLEELKTVPGQLAEEKQLESLTLKEKSAYVVKQFQSIAQQRGVVLKWNKKPPQKNK